jgi:hypothetical protein
LSGRGVVGQDGENAERQRRGKLDRVARRLWPALHGQHGRMSVELYETHVAAEEVDHLAQIARLL